jgi:hypothetical protein
MESLGQNSDKSDGVQCADVVAKCGHLWRDSGSKADQHANECGIDADRLFNCSEKCSTLRVLPNKIGIPARSEC